MSLRVVKKTCVDVCFLVQGMLENNVYFISDGEATMVVDPSSDAEEIMRALDGRELDAIVLTHCHSDHVGAAADLRRLTGATVIASKIDAPEICGEKPISRDNWKFKTCPVDFRAEDGDIVEIGNMAWKVMVTPGHTKGGMCWYLVPQFGNHESGAPVLISGDTLFEGSVGRTDFEGGSMKEMRASVRKLAFLPDETIVLPGHGRQTTIGAERSRTFAQWA